MYSLQSARLSLKGIVITLTFSAICFCGVALAFFLRSKASTVPVHSLADFGWHTEKSSKSPIPLPFPSSKTWKYHVNSPRSSVGGAGVYRDWCIMFQFPVHSVSYIPVYDTISVYRKITHTGPYEVMRLVTRLEIEPLMLVSNIYAFSFVYHGRYFAVFFAISLRLSHWAVMRLAKCLVNKPLRFASKRHLSSFLYHVAWLILIYHVSCIKFVFCLFFSLGRVHY